MAVEMNGSLPGFFARKQSYGANREQAMAGSSAANSVEKKAGKAQEAVESSKSKGEGAYARSLAKLVPSVEFKVGNSMSSAKSGMTLTVNPQLLKKMQNDPAQEKETKELIQGVESAMKLIKSINQASGWTVVYKHSYIDENGKYHSVGYYRNGFMINLSDKLREERWENSEKLIQKSREKAAQKEEELQEKLGETIEEKAEEEEGQAPNKAEQILMDKITSSKDGMVYLNDTDMKAVMEAMEEGEKGQPSLKEQAPVGTNLDIKA